VIVDHMLIEPCWLRECALLFCDLTALLAGAPPLAWHWLKVWSDPAKHRGWIRGHPGQIEPTHSFG
jgi:hypothetical protein